MFIGILKIRLKRVQRATSRIMSRKGRIIIFCVYVYAYEGEIQGFDIV